jgi:tetratricopeptide (TPR) repeat protein
MQVTRGIAILNMTGNLEPLEQVFEKMNLTDSTDYITYSARVYYLQRQPDKAIEVLNNEIWTSSTMDAVFQTNRDYQLAGAWRLKGDMDQAEFYYERVATRLNEVMESSLQVQTYAGMHIAWSLARLGRTDEALELSTRLLRNNPVDKDAMLYGSLLVGVAMVKGLAGDRAGAVDDLAIALKTPGAFRITQWELHYDPDWDFMRDHPGFVELATPPAIIRTASP